MERLIYAEDLKERLKYKCLFGKEWDRTLAICEVDASTTVDAVQVVRCVDCKHRPMDNYEAPTGEDGLADDVCPYICMTDNWYTGIPDDDSFCDKGERKDGDYDYKGKGV